MGGTREDLGNIIRDYNTSSAKTGRLKKRIAELEAENKSLNRQVGWKDRRARNLAEELAALREAAQSVVDNNSRAGVAYKLTSLADLAKLLQEPKP